MFKQKLAVQVNPFGSQFDTEYLSRLYEELMASINKTGTFANFQLNINVMDQVVRNHYVSAACIRDFSARFKAQRAELFEPIFRASFNKTGV